MNKPSWIDNAYITYINTSCYDENFPYLNIVCTYIPKANDTLAINQKQVIYMDMS